MKNDTPFSRAIPVACLVLVFALNASAATPGSVDEARAKAEAQKILNSIRRRPDAFEAQQVRDAFIQDTARKTGGDRLANDIVAEVNNAIGKKASSGAAANPDPSNVPADPDTIPGKEVLDKFETTYSSKAVIATAQILSGLAPILQLSNPTNIGVQMSASLPAGTSSLRDYADHELLLRDGGFFNGYFSFFASKPSEWEKNWGDRRYAVNRLYWSISRARWNVAGAQKRVRDNPNNAELKAALATALEELHQMESKPDQMYFYIAHAVGFKAIKTSLEKDDLALTGVGNAYLGFGVDGPLLDSSSDSKGSMSIEAFAAYNVTSKRAMRALYGAGNAAFTAPTSFGTWGVQARFYIVDQVFVSVSYYKPINSEARHLIHEVTAFNIGYGKKKDKKADVNK
jgi:hypothetical protein